MTRPSFWIASLAVLILVAIWTWLMALANVHGFVTPPMGALSWWLGQIVFAIVFVFIYTKGMSGAKGEGFRYGLFLGLLWYLPGFFMGWPGTGFGPLLLQLLAGLIGFIIYGMGACMLYKAPKEA